MAKSSKKPSGRTAGSKAPVKTSKSGRSAKPIKPARPSRKSAAKAKSGSKTKPPAEFKSSSPKLLVKSTSGKSAGSRKTTGKKTVEDSFKPGSAGPAALPPLPEPPVPPPLPERVTTDTKPKPNQAGLTQRELEHFRMLLLEKRREILGDMSSMEREALRSAQGSNLSNMPVHMADMGTDNYEQEFTLGLVEKDRQLLREINNALAKIQAGTYGLCEATGKPISKPRLEAQPWARYSIEYAREMEKRQMRR